MKSHVDKDSCLPIYKTILEICDAPPQIQYVRNYIFLHFVMVITVLWAQVWFVVVCRALFFFFKRDAGSGGIICHAWTHSSPPSTVFTIWKLFFYSLCHVFYSRVVWIHIKACILCRWRCCMCLACDSVALLHCGGILSGVARFQHFMKFQSIEKRDNETWSCQPLVPSVWSMT